MLKYRLVLTPSIFPVYINLAFYLLAVASVLSWQSRESGLQALIQLILIVILTLLAVKQWREIKDAKIERVVMLAEDGDWLYLDEDSSGHWRISSRSRISPFLLWVHLQPKMQSVDAKGQWQLIFKDQLPEADYRRICRIIIRVQNDTYS